MVVLYGEELAQVAYFEDFAIWIPWAVGGETG
jgi:hypothetical protein